MYITPELFERLIKASLEANPGESILVKNAKNDDIKEIIQIGGQLERGYPAKDGSNVYIHEFTLYDMKFKMFVDK